VTLGGRKLVGADDAQTQQVEVGAAVHGAFDQFQSVNMPFDGAIAPVILQRRKNSCFIAAEMGGKSS
jgi:hypothetical protein